MISAHVEVLTKRHDIASFTCGDGDLNDWLHRKAMPMGGQGLNRTHLWIEDETSEILGYFALAPTVVTLDEQMGETSPALLLAKFALCEQLRGKSPKMGPRLLVEALTIAVAAADLVGGQFLAVDAMHKATHDFYERAGFVPVEGDPERLIQKFKAIRAAIA